jgi:SAM-dependent methyltransferase
MTESASRDYLWLNLRALPYFRGLLRAVEARFYQDYPLEGPTLDLGCGDGDFAEMTFSHKLAVGLDPWTGPVHRASKLGIYDLTVQGSGDRMPFEAETFNSAISNSVLEHIPDVEAVLKDVGRVLKPGSLFLFCVPNHNFLNNLSVSNFLDKISLHGLADAYRRFFNRISRHYHCDDPEVWQERLEKAGFRIEKYWHYFSPRALAVLEWGHYFGLPALVAHALFGRWILAPYRWNFALTNAVVKPVFSEPPEHPQGSYTFYVVRRV